MWAAGAVLIGVGSASATASPWSMAEPACAPCGDSDIDSVLEVAPSGGAVIGWETNPLRGAVFRSAGGALDRAQDKGPFPRNTLTTGAIGADGTAVVAWASEPTLVGDLSARVRAPGGDWDFASIGRGANPSAAVAEDGTAYLAFEPIPGDAGPIQQLARRAPGGSWTIEKLPTDFAAEPHVAAGGGLVIVTWREARDAGQALSSVRENGVWQPPQEISRVGAPQKLVVDHRGTALAIWVGLGEDHPIYVARRPRNGTWSAPQVLDQGAPSGADLGVDAAGNAIATWIGAGEPGRPPAIKTALFDAFSQTWGAPTAVGEAPAPVGGAARTAPSLGVGSAGEAVILWVDRNGVRAAHGSSLTGRFGPPEVVEGFDPKDVAGRQVQIGVDREGRALAAVGVGQALRLATRAPGTGEPVRLTAAQVLINQRISQAALRRAKAALAALDAGLPAAALREGGLSGPAFGSSVTLAGTPSGAERPAGERYAVPVPAPPARSGGVRVTAAQLRINQRIAQAAVRQSNALAARLAAGLTGRDLADGAITASKLAIGLSITATSAPPAPGPGIDVPAGTDEGGEVTPSAAQLAINQRISQAAVRRSNAAIALLESGLTDADFAPGSLTARELAPGLR